MYLVHAGFGDLCASRFKIQVVEIEPAVFADAVCRDSRIQIGNEFVFDASFIGIQLSAVGEFYFYGLGCGGGG